MAASFFIIYASPEILAQNQSEPNQAPAAEGDASPPTFTTTDLAPSTGAPELSPGGIQTPAADASAPSPSSQTSQTGQTGQAVQSGGGSAGQAVQSGGGSGGSPVKSSLVTDSPGIDIIKALGAFVAVIAVLLIFLKLLSYLTRGRKLGKGGQSFTLKGTMILDSRRYLAAVEVGGHFLVIGVTPDRLTALANWPLADEGAESGLFRIEDAVEGPKAFAPSATAGVNRSRTRPRRSAPSTPAAQASPASPVTQAAQAVSPAVQAPPEAAASPAPTLEKTASGPGLGPGRGTGLGADPRTAPPEGPILDLSLDDAVFDGPETNDDFLKMFEDDKEGK